MKWIPEFALNWSERQSLSDENAVDLLRRAAASIYTTNKYHRRGEFGELFLHAAIRQVFNSSPAISKIFYKTARNDTVKGFDAVHVVGEAGNLELWLGEVKFYANYKKAVAAVVTELHAHTTTDYLRGEFALILNKLDKHWPHNEEIKRLLSPEVSLDQVFTRICIPVMLTYNSHCVSQHTSRTDAYIQAFCAEVKKQYRHFSTRKLPVDLHIHLFLLPLHSKKLLVAELDKKLKAWQNI